MTSGQDVSECLDTFGLVKSYFSSFLIFFEKEIKKNDILFVVLRRLSGSGDLPVCRITC